MEDLYLTLLAYEVFVVCQPPNHSRKKLPRGTTALKSPQMDGSSLERRKRRKQRIKVRGNELLFFLSEFFFIHVFISLTDGDEMKDILEETGVKTVSG